MRYLSTRSSAPPASLSEAVRNGAAPDGGLYLPETLPAVDYRHLGPPEDLPAFAARLLAPFFAGDRLESELEPICAESFDFPVPLVAPLPGRPGLHALELFHGPTGAFKDFGARFLMGCFERQSDKGERLTVLAATSGDTGGAVGCAAEGRDHVRAIILFPRGRVSPFQERQLICWGEPVTALEVDGDFDDCQRLVKAAFADPALAAAHRLSSANSINLGRWLPQMASLAAAAVAIFGSSGIKPGFIIPSGNLGHGFAALYARAMGMPIGPIVLATNANVTLSEWAATGDYAPRPSVATLANAMDVGAPSNFERLIALPPEYRRVSVERVEDDAISTRIRADGAAGYLWCPHSAVAAEAYERLSESRKAERAWIVAATAHPFKFAETIEPLIGRRLEAPRALRAILDRPVAKREIAADLADLARALAPSGERAAA
ncbi:MAG: threonine synthase [Allosphingosinicella sp.]